MVTRSTFGLDGQRASSSFSTRAVVDLPTATEPAMPMMNGVLTTSDGVEEAPGAAETAAGSASTWADSSRDSDR